LPGEENANATRWYVATMADILLAILEIIVEVLLEALFGRHPPSDQLGCS
jgi:hypothetical protein